MADNAIAGRTGSTDGDVSDNHGELDLWVVKLDASGNKQWAKTFGGSNNEQAESIIATSDGGYVVAGHTASTDGDVTGNHGSSAFDAWVLKLNSSGILQWSKNFGGSGEDRATSVIAAADGGYTITGYAQSSDGDFTSNLGDYDILVVKLDAFGTKQWAKTYGGSNEDKGNSIIATMDGGYAIAGDTESTDNDVSGNHGDSDGWVIKLDASGAKQWSKTFGDSNYDYGRSIVATSSEQYIISGYVESTDGDYDTDGFIIALDVLGNETND